MRGMFLTVGRAATPVNIFTADRNVITIGINVKTTGEDITSGNNRSSTACHISENIQSLPPEPAKDLKGHDSML